MSDNNPKSVMTIRIKDFAAVTLAPNNIPLSEKLVVRKATGLPFDAFAAGEDKIGEDSLAVMWWLARRANGEPMLTWTQAESEWPQGLTEDDFDVEIDEPEDGASDPEA